MWRFLTLFVLSACWFFEDGFIDHACDDGDTAGCDEPELGPPVIVSVLPDTDSPLGGREVTITGENLNGAHAAVNFIHDGWYYLNPEKLGGTDNYITIATPPLEVNGNLLKAGSIVDVQVCRPDGECYTLEDAFTYE
jgi:hypothetical protein